VTPGSAARATRAWEVERDTWQEAERPPLLGLIDRVERPADHSHTPLARTDEDVQARFKELADQWLTETGHLSSISQRVLNPSYQQIIGLGPQVVPCLIESLREGPQHWFSALVAVVGVDHAFGARTPSEAASRWVAWFDATTSDDE